MICRGETQSITDVMTVIGLQRSINDAHKGVETKQADKPSTSEREIYLKLALKWGKLSTGENVLTKDSFGFKVTNAADVIDKCVKSVCFIDGVKPLMPKWYASVADWLTDTKGRWLFVKGSCGAGKSFITMVILQMVFDKMGMEDLVCTINWRTIRNSWKYAKDPSKKIIILDDVGRETKYFENGSEVNPVAEVLNYAYSHKQLVIMSTNFGSEELAAKYGAPVVDRLLQRSFIINIKDKKSLRYSEDYTDANTHVYEQAF